MNELFDVLQELRDLRIDLRQLYHRSLYIDIPKKRDEYRSFLKKTLENLGEFYDYLRRYRTHALHTERSKDKFTFFRHIKEDYYLRLKEMGLMQ